jgi:hypothetical protein
VAHLALLSGTDEIHSYSVSELYFTTPLQSEQMVEGNEYLLAKTLVLPPDFEQISEGIWLNTWGYKSSGVLAKPMSLFLIVMNCFYTTGLQVGSLCVLGCLSSKAARVAFIKCVLWFCLVGGNIVAAAACLSGVL